MSSTSVLDRPLSAPADWTRPTWSSRLPVGVLSILTVVLYSALSLVRWSRMKAGVDLAIFAQAAQRYAHGQLPMSGMKSIDGFNLLGDHFSPAVALFAPFYRLVPHAWVLLIVQAALVGLTTAIIGWTAQRLVGPSLGLAVAACFALSWGIQAMALFDVHEVAFALPLLAIALLRLVERRDVTAIAWAASLMLVKEDSVFLLLGIALVLLVRRRRRLAVALAAYAVTSFAVITLVLIPHIGYYGRYTYWSASAAHGVHSAGGLGSALVSSLWSVTTGARAPLLILVLLAPTLGLALRSPILLALVPSLASRLTAPDPAYTGLALHYNATAAVVVTVAALDALVRMRARGVGLMPLRAWAGASVAVTLVLTWWAPVGQWTRVSRTSCLGCQVIARVLTHVPDGSRVAADDTTAAYLVDRAQVVGLHSHFRDSTGRDIDPQYVAFDRLRSKAWAQRWIDTHFHVPGTSEELGEAVWLGMPDGQYDVIVFQLKPPP